MKSFLFISEPTSGDSRLVTFNEDEYDLATQARLQLERIVPRHVEVIIFTSETLDILPSQYFGPKFREFKSIEEAIVEPFASKPKTFSR